MVVIALFLQGRVPASQAPAAAAQSIIPPPTVVLTDGKPSEPSSTVSINPSTGAGSFAVTGGDSVLRLSFAPGGRWLLAARFFGGLDVWDTRTWTKVRSIQTHHGRVTAVAASPDGQTVATGGDDKTVKMWLATGELVTTVRDLHDYPDSLAFSPSGHLLAINVNGDSDLIYDLSRRSVVKELSVTGFAFSASGAVLVAAVDNTLSFWDVKTWTMNRQISDPARGWISSVILDERMDRVVAGGRGGYGVRIWRSSAGTPTVRFDSGFVAGLAISSDGRWVFTAGDGLVRLWSAETGRQACAAPRRGLSDLVASDDGRWMAAAVANTAQVWAVDALVRGCEQSGQ